MLGLMNTFQVVPFTASSLRQAADLFLPMTPSTAPKVVIKNPLFPGQGIQQCLYLPPSLNLVDLELCPGTYVQNMLMNLLPPEHCTRVRHEAMPKLPWSVASEDHGCRMSCEKNCP